MAGAWLLALCAYSVQAGPLDTAKPGAGDQPSPFIIVAQSIGPGDPFNDNTDRVAEASVLESGKSSPRTAKCCYRRLYRLKFLSAISPLPLGRL